MACSLGAGDLEERVRAWERLARAELVGGEDRGAALVLRFRPPARAELERLVELERDCCAFLDFAVEPEGADVVLRVSGPPEAAATLDGFRSMLRLVPAAR